MTDTNAGDKVLLVDKGLGLSSSSGQVGAKAVLHKKDVGRGPSALLDVGDTVAMLDKGVGQATHKGGKVVIIDSLEDQSLSEYDDVDKGKFSVVNSPTAHENYALRCASNGASIKSLPGDGLNYYPQRGDKFKLHIRLGTEYSGAEMWFGAQNYDTTGPGYSVGMRHRASSTDSTAERGVFLQTYGGTGVNKTATFSTQADTYYTVEVRWGFPTISASVYHDGDFIESIQLDDSQWDSGGVGFDTSQSESPGPWEMYWDGVRKTGEI